MASRKTKPREKKTPRRVPVKAPAAATPATDPTHDDLAITDEQPARPSLAKTREAQAATEALLAEDSAPGGSAPHGLDARAVEAARAAAAVERRSLDDLAQTLEAPAAAPRNVILDAGEAIIGERGLLATTDSAIASRAGVSLDVFHAHFASKSALLYALSERFCTQAMSLTDETTKSGSWSRSTPREVIEVAARTILDVVLGRAGLIRAVLASGDEKMLDGFRRVGAHITERVARVLGETHAPPEERPDPRDVGFALLLAVSFAHHTIMVGTEWTGLDFERGELYERVMRAIAAYLDAQRRPS